MIRRKNRVICIIFTGFFLLLISKKQKIFENEKKVKLNNNNRYIVYECIEGMGLCGGWGDRLKGIYSAYAWSLLSKRKFYININKPCPLTNMLEPNNIDWNTSFSELYNNNPTKEFFNKIDNNIFKESIINFKLDEFERNTTDIIIIRNNLDWLESMSKNRHIQERLRQLGFNTNEFKMQFLFQKWFNKLFKLNSNLEIKYKYYLNLIKPNNNIKLICAQIRTDFLRRGAASLFWNYIRNNFIKKDEKKYNIFLTTDLSQIEIEGKEEFGEKLFLINGTIVHIDQTVRKSSIWDYLFFRKPKFNLKCPNEIEKTFLDFYMLQNCDMAIISESGFGKLGVWNRLNPNENLVMINKKQQVEIKNSTNELFIF
jgi:hypothetical protein